MKKLLFILAGVAGLSVALLYLFWTPRAQMRDWTGITGDAVRGAYVARLADCASCHTLPKGAGPLFAGGAPIKTPFGSFSAPDITSDPVTGIGSWTRDAFAQAVLNGADPDGSSYYPVFPYPSFAHLSTQDVADLWAYLKTVPPAPSTASGHDLTWPFSQRVLMRAWKNLFFRPAPFKPNLKRGAAWNRGAYIVTGPGHCGECHSPRGWLGNTQGGRALSGGIGPDGKKVPTITARALAEDGWTRGDVAFALRLGLAPDGDTLDGAMAEVIAQSTRHFTPEDRSAIDTYILDLPDPAPKSDR